MDVTVWTCSLYSSKYFVIHFIILTFEKEKSYFNCQVINYLKMSVTSEPEQSPELKHIDENLV